MKTKITILLIICIIFSNGISFANNETLPQLEKVTFENIENIFLPENPRKNYKANPDLFSNDNLFYHDDTIDIKTYKIRQYDTNIIVSFIQIADAKQLKTEQARQYPSQATMRIQEINKRVNAIISCNADWFVYHNTGIVYRNGERLRNRENEEYDGLAIDTNGDLHIVRPMTNSEYEKIQTPIMQSFVFGPALVMDNKVLEIVDRKITYKQRMAIGQVAPLSYVLVATDGPDQENSKGLNVPQLAELIHKLGAHTAYNLDGGQSTSIMMNDLKLNGDNPKRMRAVGDIIYFTTGVENK